MRFSNGWSQSKAEHWSTISVSQIYLYCSVLFRTSTNVKWNRDFMNSAGCAYTWVLCELTNWPMPPVAGCLCSPSIALHSKKIIKCLPRADTILHFCESLEFSRKTVGFCGNSSNPTVLFQGRNCLTNCSFSSSDTSFVFYGRNSFELCYW